MVVVEAEEEIMETVDGLTDVKLVEDVAATVAMLVDVSAMMQKDMAEADTRMAEADARTAAAEARAAAAEAKLPSVSGKKNRFRGSMNKGLILFSYDVNFYCALLRLYSITMISCLVFTSVLLVLQSNWGQQRGRDLETTTLRELLFFVSLNWTNCIASSRRSSGTNWSCFKQIQWMGNRLFGNIFDRISFVQRSTTVDHADLSITIVVDLRDEFDRSSIDLESNPI